MTALLRHGTIAATLMLVVAISGGVAAARYVQGSAQPVPPGGFAPVGASSASAAAAPQEPATTAAGQAPAASSAQAGAEGAGKAPSPADPLSPPLTIDVSPSGTITLSARDVPVDSLLELLSVRSKQNIVASDKVDGTVSVNLYDVPFAEALEAILGVNGLISARQGAFIFVYTQQEFADAENAKRQIGTQVFTLQFLNAADAEGFVTPILSKDGRMASRGSVTAGFTPTAENGGADEYAYTARIVVNDYANNLAEIGRVLKEIDVAPQQVRVEATVVSASVDEDNSYGLDIAAIGNLNFQNIVASAIPPLGVPDALQTGRNATGDFLSPYPTNVQAGTVTNDVKLPNSPSPNMRMGLVYDDVAVFLTILDEVTDITVLARPAVTCLNRQRAAVLIGERVAYLSTTQNQTSTTQTVNYLDTGIQLTFRPFITDDGMIRMELIPSISDYSLRRIGVPGGGFTEVPDESSQELRTNVRVRSGQTIVLGGLFSDKIVSRRRQVPFLSEIPLIGGAISGQADQLERDEIIFLVTPTIVEDQKLYEEGRDSLEVAQDVRVGARAGLLPFSREQVAANYQQDAFAAYARGDTKQALGYARAALRLKPVLPAMLRLKEQLTALPGSQYQEAVDQTIFERQTFSPGTPSAVGLIAVPRASAPPASIPPSTTEETPK